ncbi:MAG: hypothetical protein KC468_00155, partial [Myxococcales bacterium]|nr:hypothetical protein [Myxococcales bacterium]
MSAGACTSPLEPPGAGAHEGGGGSVGSSVVLPLSLVDGSVSVPALVFVAPEVIGPAVVAAVAVDSVALASLVDADAVALVVALSPVVI